MIGRPFRSGFTLIEILVALVVSGMTVTASAALLAGLGDRANTIERAAASVDGDANGERLLRQIVANVTGSPDSTPLLVGDERGLSVWSWCETPYGWLDHCKARLRFEHDTARTTLRLFLTGAEGADSAAFGIRSSVENGRLRYLVNAKSRGIWTDEWTHFGPPEAVAVILDADTLLLPVGGSNP